MPACCKDRLCLSAPVSRCAGAIRFRCAESEAMCGRRLCTATNTPVWLLAPRRYKESSVQTLGTEENGMRREIR